MTNEANANQEKNICIFVDAQNFRENLYTHCGRTDLDVAKFQKYLVDGRTLQACYYYDSLLFNSPKWAKRYEGQQKLHSAVNSLENTHVVKGRRVWRDNTCSHCNEKHRYSIEKGVDVKLAVDMIRGAIQNQYDIAVLVSGDADFIPVIEAIRNIDLHKKIEIAFFQTGHSRNLREACDIPRPLDSSTFKDMWIKR